MTTDSFNKNELLPLCVDLDGTLIHSDVTLLSAKLLIQQKCINIFKIMLWIFLGRAYLKHHVAKNIDIEPAHLPYNIEIIDYLKSQFSHRPIYLVTAADVKYARVIANYLGLFNDVMASNGHTNLRAQNKANALNIRFGVEKYIYIGNSFDDLYVWKDSAESWICTNNQSLIRKVQQLKKPIRYFNDDAR